MQNIVLDTNCLLPAIKRDSVYFPIWEGLMSGKYCLCFTDDILDEYEEILAQKTTQEIAKNIVTAILNCSNTKHVEVYYKFGLIKDDVDDNKFVDCAIKANAQYIVTEDHHFTVLKAIPFPKVEIMGIDEFLRWLSHYSSK